MKKLLTTFMLSSALLASQFAQAATICDAKTALSNARQGLISMVGSTDDAEQKAFKININEATFTLDDTLKVLLADDHKNDDAQLMVFKKAWTDFKHTRETEIIPAIYAGDNAKAKSIATGIQAGRMETMNNVISTLGGDSCK
jgi:hypothetical protein